MTDSSKDCFFSGWFFFLSRPHFCGFLSVSGIIVAHFFHFVNTFSIIFGKKLKNFSILYLQIEKDVLYCM
ncbi:MAG: hypothetical protein IKC43_04020 [Clostridia bacterium]|nr:hypothetical protein [Clostridia bacterium]